MSMHSTGIPTGKARHVLVQKPRVVIDLTSDSDDDVNDIKNTSVQYKSPSSVTAFSRMSSTPKRNTDTDFVYRSCDDGIVPVKVMNDY